MADLAISLERTMGWPVDVECAIHGDVLYLLQCRPITTLMTDHPPGLVLQGAREGIAIAGR
jgi:phosphoenolpyruvate synthase/pyruvate phosphate dikinase